MSRVLLLHGFMGDSKGCFLPFLKERYERDHEVIAPDLPDPHTPNVAVWIDTVTKLVGEREVSLCVCHSLGGTLAMNMISQDVLRVKTLATLGSSHGPKDDDLMDPFLVPPIKMESLKKLHKFYAIASYDDPATMAEYSALLVKQAGAVGVFYSEEGHFLEETVPEDILTLLDNSL